MVTVYVSPFGDDDANQGTLAAPYKTIRRGVQDLQSPGDVLFLRGGTYAQNVVVRDKHGTAEAPILIRAYGRERVSIDGGEPLDIDDQPARFRIGGNDEWTRAIEVDPDAHASEYLSVRTFPTGPNDLVRHGAFMDREPYTRLITYSRLEDLRADNQTFGRLPLDDPLPPFPGFPVVRVNEDGTVTVIGFKQPDGTRVETFKHPWVYMGPGMFFDTDGRIHLRLSHTTNHVPGIADYDGGTDPRQLRLAISPLTPSPLVVEKCSFVRFDHIDVRFGGQQTIRIEESTDVVFDHVRVFAGSDGIRIGGGNLRVTFQHCEVLGGIPTWMFRSDIKDEYSALTPDGVITNRLGHGTSQALLLGAPTNVDTEIHHCELVDGHDLALFGRGTRFHHNLVDNVHDDGLIVDTEETHDLEVSQNVITRCLAALSFARDGQENIGGIRRVHRNLIDLRGPTTSIRPRPSGHLIKDDDDNQDGSVFRTGQLYKAQTPDGPLDLFQNTCLVANRNANAGIQHYGSAQPGDKPRRSFNNIFVDATPGASRPADYASAFLPGPAFSGPTDANGYIQIPEQGVPVLRHRGYDLDGVHVKADEYASLDDYRAGIGLDGQNPHHEHSKLAYPPGFEHDSFEGSPPFRRIAADGVAQFDDDLRLQDPSPALNRGRVLADPDVGIDDPLAHPGAPDLGCYQLEDHGLDVGVNSRRRFPEPS